MSKKLSHLEESEKKDVSATDKDKPDVTSSDDQAESSNNEKKLIVQSVGFDFLYSPKVDVESVDDNSTDSNITGPKKLFTQLADDCLITTNKPAAGSAVHRSAKMPSVDRSTKPTSSSSATTLPSSSAVLNNTVSDTASDLAHR